jgi:hypothetical protein
MATITKSDLLTNPKLRALISQKDQISLGLQMQPPLSKGSSFTGKPELQSHAEFLSWIKKLNRSLPVNKPLLVIHANPACPSGILPGWPDFSLFYSAPAPPLFIEFKRPKQGRLSNAQALIHRYLTVLGLHPYIVFSSAQAISLTQNHFRLSSI